MTINELDIGEDKQFITLKRSTYYGLVATIIILLVVFTAGGLVGYASVTSPKTFCSYITTYHVGDQDAQDGCYYKLAKEYRDIDFCNGIQNGDLQKECARIVGEITDK